MIITKIDNKNLPISYKFVRNRIVYNKIENKIAKLFISNKSKKNKIKKSEINGDKINSNKIEKG